MKRGVVHDCKTVLNSGRRSDTRAPTRAHPTPFGCDQSIKKMKTLSKWRAGSTQNPVVSPKSVVGHRETGSKDGLAVYIKTQEYT